MTDTEHDEFTGLLPFYVAGSLDEADRRGVERHLRTCRKCQGELEIWREVGTAIADEPRVVVVPSPAILEGALTQLRASEPSVLGRSGQLLLAQMTVVRREFWLTSFLVMVLGYLVAIVGGRGEASGILAVVAPLVAAAGVALAYGNENDPALELALATPTSPRQVLLARLVLVFGYDLALALAATLGLLAILPVGLLGSVVLGWLGPMTCLSALALVLSLRFGTDRAVIVAFSLWLGRWLARDLLGQPLFVTGLSDTTRSIALIYEQGWANSTLLFALAAVCLVIAFRLVGRDERFLKEAAWQAG